MFEFWDGKQAAEVDLERLKAAVDQAEEGVFIADLSGRIVYGNAAYVALAGHDCTRMMDWNSVGMPDDTNVHDRFRDIIAILHAGKAWKRELETATKDGTRHLIRRTVSPVLQGGKLAFAVGLDCDITEERTQQTKMEHTQHLEILGVLAGGIAHDFNNILTAIMGNAALARQKLKDIAPDVAGHLERIERSSQRAAELCQQMLDYSGKGKFAVKAVNLSHRVKEITTLLRVSIAKNVVFKFHLIENPPLIRADAVQLRQMIMNLAINAGDAVGKNGGIISLTTGVMQVDTAYLVGAYAADDVRQGRYVFLEVSDSGCGMDRATLAKLFNPFFTTKFIGRGLGMSAVLGIMRGHHGAIKVYSEAGNGTTITVLFPVPDGKPVDVRDFTNTSGTDGGAGYHVNMLQQHRSSIQ